MCQPVSGVFLAPAMSPGMHCLPDSTGLVLREDPQVTHPVSSWDCSELVCNSSCHCRTVFSHYVNASKIVMATQDPLSNLCLCFQSGHIVPGEVAVVLSSLSPPPMAGPVLSSWKLVLMETRASFTSGHCLTGWSTVFSSVTIAASQPPVHCNHHL